jgi:hypothetical protein
MGASVCALLQDIHHDLGARHQLRRQLLFFRIVSTHSGNKRARPYVLTIQEPLP